MTLTHVGRHSVAVKITRKTDPKAQILLTHIEKLWGRIEVSEMDRQRLVSYLRGIQIAKDPKKLTEFDRDVEFMQEVLKCRD